MSLNETPRGDRIHIAFFGKTNVGKSSIINKISNSNISIVSDVRGTTTDPVFKSIEIFGIGASVLIDTAGFDDESILSEKRIDKTLEILDKTDISVIVVSDEELTDELIWIEKIKEKNIPYIMVVNKEDIIERKDEIKEKIISLADKEPIFVSAKNNTGIEEILNSIRQIYSDYKEESICGFLVKQNDVVLLVIPQDIQAPKGRLILPQVQTIRDLLENKCTIVCTTDDKYENAINSLKNSPDLIIVDSQIFPSIYPKKPEKSKMTSFSVLFSRYKGDIDEFVKGASYIDMLKEGDRVLIAEACLHNPQDGDIARVKLPNMLKKKTGKNIYIEVVSGNNFPQDLSLYSLIIHCGACMFNKKYVLNRIDSAKKSNIPITNYGIAIAYMSGILNKIEK